jgi:hypothetical protein
MPSKEEKGPIKRSLRRMRSEGHQKKPRNRKKYKPSKDK